MGDGEMDEPESLGAISLAGREKLDNLIFVINCNLQRLDGPVRGNGKIIQELEADFRGSGWNVIKLVWGAGWDELLAKGRDRAPAPADGGMRRRRIPGFQVQERRLHPREILRPLSRDAGDGQGLVGREDLELTRGGHDSRKVFAAYKAASEHKGQPTLILAKTVKGYGMGSAGEAQMMAHQAKKMNLDALKQFRDRFKIPVADSEIEHAAADQVPRRFGRAELPAQRRARARRLSARPPAPERAAGRSRRCRRSKPSSRPPTAAKSRPRWPSCAC